MSPAKKYKSKILGAIHETASDLSQSGVMDKKTLREFDAMCLTSVAPLSPDEIREIRLRERVSQAVFALHLNVTTGLVSKWERGDKHPTGPSLKLLQLVKDKGLETIA
ncbi:MAG: DNA-binding transcriptional regulator [Candidatus Hinthialibacter antarcticus]|nr:DNA-binding transcriptional regulator [Candidatus Hinthialibacter antarcticus]